MKIMYLVYSFTTGGTEKLVTDICNQMCKNNQVYLYVVNRHYSEEMLKLIDSKVVIELENRKIGCKNIFKTMNNISKFIRKNNIEIVHCNSLNAPELLFITKLINPKIKVFYTIHGLEQYKLLNYIKKLYRNIICKNIIAISNAVKNDIINSGACKKKTLTVYNAINTSNFSEINKKKFNINEPVIGNIARIVPEIKGQDTLIEAVKILKKDYPNIKCYFAGSTALGQEEKLIKLKEKVNSSNLQENIKFTGNIVDVKKFLEKVDIFVLPSIKEGFGIALIEAMSMGIPVISSNAAGPAEIILNEQCGKIFNTCDANDLAIKIKELINNYNIEKEKAMEKVSDIKQKYDIASMCNELEKIYGG